MSSSFLMTGIAVCLFGLSVQSCDSNSVEPPMAAGLGLHSDQKSRVVTVYLQANPVGGFSPTFADRIVTAAPTHLVPITQAVGEGLYQNTSIGYIGESCEKLRAEIPDLLGCSEAEAFNREYGEIESTATTNLEGFAVLHLGQQENYQISVQSWPTREDDKCGWDGSEILEQGNSTISIQLVVFCQ